MNDFLNLFDVAYLAGDAGGLYGLSGSIPTFSTGDPPEFEEIFDSATATIEEDPKNAQAYFMRGVVCQSKRWYPQALADFVDVVKIDPKHAKAWLLMSEVLAIIGETEKAKVARQQAMEIDPSL